jgi:cell division control protein 6
MQTKSCLCEQELVFPPYNADELSKILEERIKDAFKQGAVSQEAINLISAYSAQEAGDARRALILLQKSGDLADLEKSSFVGAKHVQEARKKVEQELILNMVLTLPKQHQIALYTIALLDLEGKGTRKLNELNSNFSWESLGNYVKEQRKETVLTTGEIYDRYKDLAESIEMPVVSTRWFKEYLNELESYGLVLTTESGKGFRGTTTLTRLGFQANKIKEVLEKELF